MPIIQFVLPSKDKRIKKLLHFYWEVCPKLDESGKLKQEMILVWCVCDVECWSISVLTCTLCTQQCNPERPGTRRACPACVLIYFEHL